MRISFRCWINDLHYWYNLNWTKHFLVSSNLFELHSLSVNLNLQVNRYWSGTKWTFWSVDFYVRACTGEVYIGQCVMYMWTFGIAWRSRCWTMEGAHPNWKYYLVYPGYQWNEIKPIYMDCKATRLCSGLTGLKEYGSFARQGAFLYNRSARWPHWHYSSLEVDLEDRWGFPLSF